MKNASLKFTINTLIAIFLLGMIPQVSYSQWASASMTTYPKRVKSIKSIDYIKKGVLVIRLESKSNNIKKLTESIELKEIDNKLRRQLKVQRAQMISDRDKFNNDLMDAFYKDYEFSDFVFMMDTSSVHLLDGVTEGIFLDKEGNIDPSISIKDKKMYIMRIGKLSSENTTGIEALIFSDDKLNDLQRPFPYYVNLNHRLMLRGLFSKKGSIRRDGEDLVEEVTKKFNSFYAYYLKKSYLQQNN